MSTKAPLSSKPALNTPMPLTIRELTKVLVKHYGLKQGEYDLLVEYQIGTGAVGPDKDNMLPGAMIGVSRIGLTPATTVGPTTVDAAVTNPSKKSKVPLVP